MNTHSHDAVLLLSVWSGESNILIRTSLFAGTVYVRGAGPCSFGSARVYSKSPEVPLHANHAARGALDFATTPVSAATAHDAEGFGDY